MVQFPKQLLPREYIRSYKQIYSKNVVRFVKKHDLPCLTAFVITPTYQQSMIVTQHDKLLIPSGLPDFPLDIIPKFGKIYQLSIKYTKWPQNIPIKHKIYQMASKYTKGP
jgi:hypothetical protein